MKLPTKFTVGKTQYIVQTRAKMTGRTVGAAWVEVGVIHVRTQFQRKVRPDYGVEGQHETFWHETTHAILYDMKHALWDDEVFVTQFARRLAQVIETSEFENGTT
jgi:hypothetical protein